MRLTYADEKYDVALRALVVGLGTIQQRVRAAFMSFHTITEDDLPEGDLRDAHAAIMKPVDNIAALAHLPDEEATHLAECILDLRDNIADTLREQNSKKKR